MKEEEIREGDIVEIDYIEEFTKEHINEGKALVIWKGNCHQPLVRKLNTRGTLWTCYEHMARVVGHIDIEDYMDKALNMTEVESKSGYWILADEQSKEDVENDNYRFTCSECKCSDIHAKSTKVPYCWKCGAKMEVEE